MRLQIAKLKNQRENTGNVQGICSSQFCNPAAEPFHGFHDDRSGGDEQEAAELCHQQDQKLKPLPAVQRIKAAAKNIQHGQSQHKRRQVQRPFQHQRKESRKQPKRENDHLKNKPHIQHLPFFCPYYKGGNHCIARMSPPYVPPQSSNCGEKFRVLPAGKESADQSQSVHPAAAAGPPCLQHRPDHFH